MSPAWLPSVAGVSVAAGALVRSAWRRLARSAASTRARSYCGAAGSAVSVSLAATATCSSLVEWARRPAAGFGEVTSSPPSQPHAGGPAAPPRATQTRASGEGAHSLTADLPSVVNQATIGPGQRIGRGETVSRENVSRLPGDERVGERAQSLGHNRVIAPPLHGRAVSRCAACLPLPCVSDAGCSPVLLFSLLVVFRSCRRRGPRDERRLRRTHTAQPSGRLRPRETRRRGSAGDTPRPNSRWLPGRPSSLRPFSLAALSCA